MQSYTKEQYTDQFGELKTLLIEKKLIGSDAKYGTMMLIGAGFFYLLGIFLMPVFGPVLSVFYFSLLFVEMGYISHDLIHNQYFSSVKWNQFFARIYANAGIGLSSSWWFEKHNI